MCAKLIKLIKVGLIYLFPNADRWFKLRPKRVGFANFGLRSGFVALLIVIAPSTLTQTYFYYALLIPCLFTMTIQGAKALVS